MADESILELVEDTAPDLATSFIPFSNSVSGLTKRVSISSMLAEAGGDIIWTTDGSGTIQATGTNIEATASGLTLTDTSSHMPLAFSIYYLGSTDVYDIDVPAGRNFAVAGNGALGIGATAFNEYDWTFNQLIIEKDHSIGEEQNVGIIFEAISSPAAESFGNIVMGANSSSANSNSQLLLARKRLGDSTYKQIQIQNGNNSQAPRGSDGPLIGIGEGGALSSFIATLLDPYTAGVSTTPYLNDTGIEHTGGHIHEWYNNNSLLIAIGIKGEQTNTPMTKAVRNGLTTTEGMYCIQSDSTPGPRWYYSGHWRTADGSADD